MSDQKTDQEPSMEEILASIRRIISEDEDEESQAAEDEESQTAEDAPSAIEDEAEPLIAEAAAPEPAPEDDVFELTQEVQDDGTVVDIATGETIHSHEAPELVEVDENELDVAAPAPIAAPIAAPVAPQVPPMAGEEGLVGPPADAASTASFESLAHVVAGKRGEMSIGGQTVEDVVKDVIRPIIKEWLDDNLPDLVERLVSREIDRMTRSAEDAAES